MVPCCGARLTSFTGFMASLTFWKAPRALLRAKIAGISRPFSEGVSYAGFVLDQRQSRALAMGQSLGLGTV